MFVCDKKVERRDDSSGSTAFLFPSCLRWMYPFDEGGEAVGFEGTAEPKFWGPTRDDEYEAFKCKDFG